MPAPKVVVVKPPPAPKTKAVDQMPFTPIRKTVAPAVAPEPKEPRPPKAVSTPPVTPVPGTALANQRATAGQGMSEGWGTGTPHPVVSTGVRFRPGGDDFNRTKPVPVEPKPYVKGLRTEATPKIAPRYSPKAQRVGHKKKAAAAKSAKAFTPAAVKAVAKHP